MKVKYLAAILALILVAGTFPYLPLYNYRTSRQVIAGEGEEDATLPYRDSDRDGMPDVWEVDYGLKWNDPTDAMEDMDRDGYDEDGDGNLSLDERYTNYEEFLNHTNPTLPDTDWDGMPDGWEVHFGLDPLRDDAWGDVDGDHLSNLGEFRNGTDPVLSDSDGDGLTDGEEVTGINGISTDPLDPDTDGDGMWDGWEVGYGLNPILDDADLDSDGDSFDADMNGTIDPDEIYSNLLEFLSGSDPMKKDTDGDGMSDGWEYLYGLDPTNPKDAYGDLDLDGLSNRHEWSNLIDADGRNWSDPRDPDTDDDGIMDGFEIMILSTDPTSNDTDMDQMPDGWEFDNGLDPLNASDAWSDVDADSFDADHDGTIGPDEVYCALFEYLNGTDPNRPDTDDDGIPDGWEVFFCFDPLNASDAQDDPDRDGWDYDRNGVRDKDENFTNLEEFLAGTSPLISDTDGDGLPDGWEVHYDLDPLNALDAHMDADNDLYDINHNGWISPVEVLDNLEEFLNDTSPIMSDTDEDGLPDVWEVFYGFNPINASDASSDPDMDGYDYDGNGDVDDEERFTNLQEFLNHTCPLKSDTDGDGMVDGWEVHYGFDPLDFTDGSLDPDWDGWDYDRDGTIEAEERFTNIMEYRNGTSIWNNDTDGDGMIDGWEVHFGLDPLLDDSDLDPDLDGLTNLCEFLNDTDPNIPDTDGDGLNDGEEIAPASDGYVTDPVLDDTDGDGMPDGWEVIQGYDPTNSTDGALDDDSDGFDFNHNGRIDENERFTNAMEYAHGTDPRDPDSDDDGLPDGWEAYYALDPNDPLDVYDDPDDDGYRGDYTNYQEYLNGTDPSERDTDHDRLPDGWEVYFGLNPLINDSMLDLDPSQGRLVLLSAAQITGDDPFPDPEEISGELENGTLDDLNWTGDGGACTHISGEGNYAIQMFMFKWIVPENPEDNDCVNNVTYAVGFSLEITGGGGETYDGLSVYIWNLSSSTWLFIGNVNGSASYDGDFTLNASSACLNLSCDVQDFIDEENRIRIMVRAPAANASGDSVVVTDQIITFMDFIGDGMSNWQEYRYRTDPLDWDTDDDGLPDGYEVS